jgi:catechol 2,3-dioxygenase-like lactoylglutathione lyase family enzyme
MNHYCIAVKDYEVAAAAATLEAEGLNPRRTQDRVYFNDPDGLTVQLSPTDHRP